MGRWAQAKRTGGGGETLVEITSAVASGGGTAIDVTWSRAVTASGLSPAAFHTLPMFEVPISVVQTSPTVTTLTFGVDISAENFLEYDGTDPGFASPQQVAL